MKREVNPVKTQYAAVFVDNDNYNRICSRCNSRWLEETETKKWISVVLCKKCEAIKITNRSRPVKQREIM